MKKKAIQTRLVLETVDDTDEKYVCESCGGSFNSDEMFSGFELCHECGAICDICEKVVYDDSIIFVDGACLCDDCVKHCTGCNQYVHPDNGNRYDCNEFYCEHCWNNLIECSNCGELVHIDDSQYCEHHGESYCDSCFCDEHGDHCGDIGVYDIEYVYDGEYREVNPIFYPEYTPELLYHGVELEVDGLEIVDACNDLINMSKSESLFYLKTDRSLSECGVEIVTHPMSIKSHASVMPWIDICKVIKRYRYHTDYDKTTETLNCGLHIHNNITFFTHKYKTTMAEVNGVNLALYKLSYLFDKYWEKFSIFSRRSYFGYCARPSMLMYANRKRAIETHKQKGKYMAVQESRFGTIETRLWAGTMKPDIIMASLEMTNGLMHYVKDATLKKVKETSWLGLMNDVMSYDDPQNLKEHLVKRSLI